MEEIWKDIKGYENIYSINNLGEIKSLRRVIHKSDGTIQTYKERILKSYISSNGYPSVSLTKNSKTIMHNIHKLLAISFFNEDYIKNNLVVNHKDGNKLNNCLDNLEIVTYSDNMLHALNNNLNKNRGINHKQAKLTITQVIEIKRKLKSYKYGMIKELSNKYNVSFYTIHGIKTNKTWKHIN